MPIEGKGVELQSVIVTPDGIPFGDMLQKEYFAGSVVGIQIVHDGSVKPEHLAEYARLIAVTYIDPNQINTAESVIDDKDRFFAEKFDCEVASRFAYLGLIGDDIEAWIGSVLLPIKHPLAALTVPNAAILFTENNGTKGGFKPREVRSFDATESGYYVRLTAEDRPNALAEICEVFGDTGISMSGIIQPPSAEGSNVADIGILFHPTLTATLHQALEQIQATAACKSVNTVLKVIS